MERLKNDAMNVLELFNSFSSAGIFESIMKGVTSKFVKDTAKTLGTKALEAGVNKMDLKLEQELLIKLYLWLIRSFLNH